MSIRRVLGLLFASPVTFLTVFLYVLPFTWFGWYEYIGWYGLKETYEMSQLAFSPVWVYRKGKGPKFLQQYWEKWAGHCVGTAVVLREHPTTSKKAQATLVHEMHHVHQMHLLGFFQPVLYAISTLLAKCSGEDSYLANIFEMSARRAAGQIVDYKSFVQGAKFAQPKEEKRS